MSISTEILADSPAVYWKLDDALGSTTAADSSGHGVVGVYGGLYTLQQQGPEVGTFAAANLGGPAVASLCSKTTPVTTLPWSLECWIATQTFAVASSVILYNGNTALRGSGVEFVLGNQNNNKLDVIVGGIGVGASIGFVYDQAFHQIVLQQKIANAVEIWLDGINVLTSASAAPNAILGTDLFQTGAGGDPCVMAHVAMYSATLSGARILAHYQGRASVQGPVFAGNPVVSLSAADEALLQAIYAAVHRTY